LNPLKEVKKVKVIKVKVIPDAPVTVSPSARVVGGTSSQRHGNSANVAI
jgi:hypothetical protein